MRSVEDVVAIYRQLADRYQEKGQAQFRDRYLVLAADAALAGGRDEEAEELRQRLLRLNPHHLLKPYGSFAEAAGSTDVQGYVDGLRRDYPLAAAERALENFGVALPRPRTEVKAPMPTAPAPRPEPDPAPDPSSDAVPRTADSINLDLTDSSDDVMVPVLPVHRGVRPPDPAPEPEPEPEAEPELPRDIAETMTGPMIYRLRREAEEEAPPPRPTRAGPPPTAPPPPSRPSPTNRPASRPTVTPPRPEPPAPRRPTSGPPVPPPSIPATLPPSRPVPVLRPVGEAVPPRPVPAPPTPVPPPPVVAPQRPSRVVAAPRPVPPTPPVQYAPIPEPPTAAPPPLFHDEGAPGPAGAWFATLLAVVVLAVGVALAMYVVARPFLP